MALLNFLVTLVGATLWHLWRIITLRPAFANLKPSYLTVGVFAAMYLAMGVTRAGLGGYSATAAGIGLLLYIGMLNMIFRFSLASFELRYTKKQFPFGPHWILILTLLGGSAAVDAVAISAFLIWEFPIYGGWFWTIADLGFILVLCGQFGLWIKQHRAHI